MGANIESLNHLMQEWAWQQAGSKHPLAWQVDLTGDSIPETIAIADYTSSSSPRRGDLLIWQCRDGQMELLFSATRELSFSGEEPGLPYYRVLQIGDANHDDQPEVIFESSRQGIHANMVALYVIEWEEGKFVQRVSGFPEMPDPIYNFSEQGITATAGWFGSVGAGVAREYSQRWVWAGPVLTISQEILGPPRARIQYLYDGDDALIRRDVATAIGNYQQAIGRTDLPAGILGLPISPKELLPAFARFKLMVAYAVAGDDDNLTMVYQELLASVPETSPAYIYVAMAQAFRESYRAGQGARYACAAATAVAAADDSAVRLLYAGYAKFAGYASTRYENPEDLCQVP